MIKSITKRVEKGGYDDIIYESPIEITVIYS